MRDASANDGTNGSRLNVCCCQCFIITILPSFEMITTLIERICLRLYQKCLLELIMLWHELMQNHAMHIRMKLIN